MRLPPQPTSLTPVYLNLLQTRGARPAQTVAVADPGASTQTAARVAPPVNGRLPRGSLIDIKA
jgi:hypothetical protein